MLTLSGAGQPQNGGGLQPTFELKYDLITTDFTFTRNSFATRVNEFGLIETVTDLGSDLIQNGSFDELGSELVTNGDFENGSTDWSFIGTANISGGVANFPDTTVSFLIQPNIIPLTVKTYKIQYEVVTTNGNNFRFAGGNSGFGSVTLDSATVGVKTVYLTSNGTKGSLQFNNNAFIGSIDNVSVKQVDPNDDWTIEALWTIQDGVASGNGATGGTEELNQNISSSGILIGSTVRGSFEIKNYVSGSVQVIGISNTISRSGNGIYEFQGDITSFNIRFRGATFNGDVTNLSIQEVLEDDVPRIDYTGSTFDVPVLGEELVVNGGFDTDSDWTKVNSTISDGKGNLDSTSSTSILFQQNTLTVGKTYKATFDVSNYNSVGTCALINSNGNTQFEITSNGNVDFYFTHGGTSENLSFRAVAGGVFSIDNVSVKEVTAYTTTDKGSFLLEPISTNLITYSEDFSDSSWNNSNISEELSSVLSPDGTSYSYKLTNDAVTGNHFLRDTITVTSGEAYTLSLFIKKGTRDIVSIADGFNINVLANFDLTNGSVTNVAATSSSIESFNNGWYRCMATITPSNTNLGLMIFSGTVYAGKDESGDFYVWGAQVEELPYATSYIPTSGTTVTRAQESCNKSNLTTDGLWGGSVGTVFLHTTEVQSNATSLNTFTPFRLYRYTGDRYRWYYDTGTAFIGNAIDMSNEGGELKMAFSVSDTDIKLYVNGTLRGTHTLVTTPPDVNLWSWAPETKYKERVENFKLYDKALTDDELINLTTI